jgi:hypothetical protein
LRDKRQELRETKDKIQAEEMSRKARKVLRERRQQAREEMLRLKAELDETEE